MRPSSLIYAVDEVPPPARLVLLSVQYAIMVTVYLVIVVIVLRHVEVTDETRISVIALALVAVAVGTLLQGLARGPVGSGFLAPPIYSAIYLAPSILAVTTGGLPLLAGMTLFAGCVELVIGLLIARLRVIFTPVVSGLTVFLVGLELGVVGVGQLLDVRGHSLPAYGEHLLVSFLTLAVCVALSIWGRGQARLLCSLLGLIVGLAAALAVGMIAPGTTAALDRAAWVELPGFAVGFLSFEVALVPSFLAAGVAAAVRTVGVVTVCQRINDSAWRRPDLRNIRKGILADGLGCMVGGAMGAPGMNISPSLVGLSSASGATSRAIAYGAALLLLLLAFSPKAAALFLAIPLQVAGAMLVFTASFMIASGMETILSRPLHTRSIYMVGIPTLLALSKTVFPHYFTDLPPFIESLTGSPLAVGLGTAILLQVFFLLGTRQSAEKAWTAAAGATAAAVDFVYEQARSWKVDEEVARLAAANAKDVLRRLEAQRPGMREGYVRTVYNGVDLKLEISCGGDRRVEPPAGRAARAFRREDLDNEEAAVQIGLRDFLHGIAADRKRIRRRRGGLVMELYYAV